MLFHVSFMYLSVVCLMSLSLSDIIIYIYIYVYNVYVKNLNRERLVISNLYKKSVILNLSRIVQL